MSILSRSVSGLKPVPTATTRSVQTPPASEAATLRDDDPSNSSGHEAFDTDDSSANDADGTSETSLLLDIVNAAKSKPNGLYLSLFEAGETVREDESGLGAEQIAQIYKKI